MVYSSVSQYIFDQYGIDIKPGRKGECPFCHKNTMSIKDDDCLAKCFHPDDGGFITLNQINNPGNMNRLNEIFLKFYYDSHEELLQTKNKAYEYLLEMRNLHPKVIQDSMIGIMPDSYDFNNLFKDVEEGANAALDNANQELSGKKYKKEKEQANEAVGRAKKLVDKIAEIKQNLTKCCNNFRGWICFYYTDEDMIITGIRLRKPYSKEFAYFKLSERSGVFGLPLFSINEDEDVVSNGELIQVEGEFNHLQLESLWLRVNELQGKDIESIGYVDCIATGSSSNPDFEVVKKISGHPIIAYDADDAGFAVVEKAREKMHVSAFRVPEPYNDLDEYIVSFGEEKIAAWNSVIKILEERKPYYRYFEPIAKEITGLRASELKEFEINMSVAQIIINDLQERVTLYNDGSGIYLFDKESKKLFEVNEDNKELTLLLHNYGINRSERLFSYLMHEMLVYGNNFGVNSAVHRFSYFDPLKFILYIFNNGSKIFRVSSGKIESVDNGTDGVLFQSNENWEPFEIKEIQPGKSYFGELILEQINFSEDKLSKGERILLLRYWIMSIFFESILPTKAIAAFIGEKGSGKSITLRKIGMLLFGPKFDVTPIPDKPDDFDIAAINSVLLAIDNADTKCSWLEDKLAVLATGGSLKRRRLYTNNEMVEIKAHCFLGITSRTPKFRRDDIADRLLIMRVARFKEFHAESDVLKDVLRHRNDMLSEILHELQAVLKVLEEKSCERFSGNIRIGDFARFAVIAGEAEGKKTEIIKALGKLSDIQSDFALEMDPLIDLITEWIYFNDSKEVTNEELYKDLIDLARANKIEFHYANHKSFAQKMASIRSDLEKYFLIRERRCGGHIIKRSFKLRTDNYDRFLEDDDLG